MKKQSKTTALNFVVKHDFNRASVHADKKRASKMKRGAKHKTKYYA